MATHWYDELKSLKPFIFKVSTPNGYGTGFHVLSQSDLGLYGIATAYHVISHEYEWQEPIKITHYASGESIVLKDNDRAILVYPANDLAFIIFFDKKSLPLEEKEPDFIDPGKILKPGAELGWCGFPHIAPDELCFFAGHTSAYLSREEFYLVDGVVINGVSGGPAFYLDSRVNKAKICGVISAYRPNRIYGEVHPGLSKVCSVKPYEEMLQALRTRAEAEKQARAEKEKQEKIDKPILGPVARGRVFKKTRATKKSKKPKVNKSSS